MLSSYDKAMGLITFKFLIIHLKESFPILYNACLCVVKCRVLFVCFVFKSKLAKYFSPSACEKRLKRSFNQVHASCESFPSLPSFSSFF